jgi:PAS domain S-box-containing protein
MLKNLPISRKLTWMNMLVSGSALLLASAAFLAYDQANFRTDLLRNLSTQAQVIASNSVSALVFNDPEAAHNTLSSLRNSPNILGAVIFGRDGQPFAQYAKSGTVANIRAPAIRREEREVYTFGDGEVMLARQIELDGKPVGTIVLRAEATQLAAHLKQYFRIVALVLVLSLLAALLVSSSFRRELAAPIVQLAEIARRVSRDKDYSVRASPTGSRDELAVLIEAFNEMLGEIHQRDAALERERARLSAVFDNAPVGIVFAEAPSGRIILGNRRAEEILQHPIYARSGDPSPFTRVVRADGQELDRRELPLMRAIQGEVVRDQEFQYLRGNGEWRWIRASAAPIRDREGKIVAGVVAFTDIEEAKRAEQELRQAYNRLAIARETAQMGDWEWDLAQDRVILSEQAQVQHGFAPGSFDGRFSTWMAAIHPADRERVRQELLAARQRGTDYERDYRVSSSNGQIRWVFSKANHQSPTESSPEKLVGVCMDITAARHAQDALLQSEKLAAAGRLAASISHEINNPLESVTNLLYLVASDPSLSAQTRTYVQQAEQEISRVSQIASQTLRFYRQSTKPSSVDLGTLLDSVLALLRGRLTSLPIQVIRQYEATAPLYCFEGELRQVFANLVGNAVDAMGSSPGRLILRTSDAHDWRSGEAGIRVSIADTGSGMPPDTLARVFEPFYSTKGSRGTGLGLWVSREIVVKHRGVMQVRSKPGKGSVFSIFFPYAGVAESSKSESANA